MNSKFSMLIGLVVIAAVLSVPTSSAEPLCQDTGGMGQVCVARSPYQGEPMYCSDGAGFGDGATDVWIQNNPYVGAYAMARYWCYGGGWCCEQSILAAGFYTPVGGGGLGFVGTQEYYEHECDVEAFTSYAGVDSDNWGDWCPGAVPWGSLLSPIYENPIIVDQDCAHRATAFAAVCGSGDPNARYLGVSGDHSGGPAVTVFGDRLV